MVQLNISVVKRKAMLFLSLVRSFVRSLSQSVSQTVSQTEGIRTDRQTNRQTLNQTESQSVCLYASKLYCQTESIFVLVSKLVLSSLVKKAIKQACMQSLS